MNQYGILLRCLTSFKYLFHSHTHNPKFIYLQHENNGTNVYSATHTAAIPIPVPTHMLVTPILCFFLLSS